VRNDFLALTSLEGQDRFGGADKSALSKAITPQNLPDWAAEKLRAWNDVDPRIRFELCWIIGVNYRGAAEARNGIEFERAGKLRSDLLTRDHAVTRTP
jgi:hypothetical protein